jgi:hypothetical protein
MAYAFAHSVSDHVPYVVQMESGVLKSNIFRFENHWVTHPEFSPTVQHLWSLPVHRGNAALVISAKFKSLCRGLKAWSRELSKLNKLINNNNFVFALLDGLEEQRPLLVIESNFRKLLKTHLISLLNAKRTYWKQWSTIRWVKFGDENIKLFQAVATQKFRRNFISHLRLEDGTSASEHEHKAAILWNSFKDRLGQTEATLMQFDLSTLIQPVQLGELDQEFSHNEIDKLIDELPLDKALGPDGFSGMFLKKCWPIIKEDFYALFDDFYHE